jgi:glycosyltransferase involved in cell wall biosynthesis
MKLSIITVNLNNAKGLLKTVSSVVSQTWQEFEYIIIDGSSSDGSMDVILQFSEKVDHWISDTDNGVYHAMNKGIRKSSGDYLLFLNSGDFLVDSDVLQKVFTSQYSEDILCAKCNMSDKGKIVWTSDPPEVFRLSHFYRATIAHQSTFIRRSLFEEYGLYREDLKLKSDMEFWIRTIILGKVSTQKIDLIVSDYNLEGISSDKKNLELSELESEVIYADLNLKNIVSDYREWDSERKEMEALYWAKSNKVLNICLLRLYNLAKWMKKCQSFIETID